MKEPVRPVWQVGSSHIRPQCGKNVAFASGFHVLVARNQAPHGAGYKIQGPGLEYLAEACRVARQVRLP